MTQARVPVFSLGERITKAYKDLGWKQDDLAARIGVDRKTLGNWIAGRHRASYADLATIAQVTGVSLDFFTEVADLDPQKRARTTGRASTEIVQPIRRRRDDSAGNTHEYMPPRDYEFSRNVTVESRYARVA